MYCYMKDSQWRLSDHQTFEKRPEGRSREKFGEQYFSKWGTCFSVLEEQSDWRRQAGADVNKMPPINKKGGSGKRTDYIELQGHLRMRPGEGLIQGGMYDDSILKHFVCFAEIRLKAVSPS